MAFEQKSLSPTKKPGFPTWLCYPCALLIAVACADRAPAQWETTPYSLHILVIPEEHSSAISAANRIVERLPILLPSVGSQAWRATAAIAPREAGLQSLAAGRDVSVERALAGLAEKDRPDKVLLLGVRAGEGEAVFAQEVDVRLRLAGTVVRRERTQRAAWEESALLALTAAFRPLARIERGTATEIVIVPRAARLLDGDQPPLALAAGDVLQPWVRRNDRYGDAKANDIQPVAWTYLQVTAPGQRRVTCRVVSGMGNPLAGRTSVRVERLAILVRPDERGTVLAFRTRIGEKGPLPGLEVVETGIPAAAAPETPAAPLADPPSLGLSDHAGELLIRPTPESPLRMLTVRHGREPLARLPIVPGATERIVAYLPDDRPRLEAEGYLLGIQQQLIDAAARREILAARCRRFVEEGKATQIEPLLVEMRALPTRDILKQQLAAQQGKFKSPDPAIQRKIDKLFTDIRSAADKHLDPALVEAIGKSFARP